MTRRNVLYFAPLFLLLAARQADAQERSKVQYGKVVAADFALPSSLTIDSSTSAVILADIGSVNFVGNTHGWLSHIYRRRTRIKILDKRAFDLATVHIHLYTPSNNDDPEKAENILASVYNLEDGKVVETRLDKKEIFEERKDKLHSETKFTLPAVKTGSVIEYTYTVTSNYDFTLPSWEFQSIDYPCLWSEFEVVIPQLLTYVFVRQGVHAFAVDKAEEGRADYKVTSKVNAGLSQRDESMFVTSNTVKHRWVMKDIPAFHAENYLSTPANYIDKIVFQLEKTYDGQDSKDVMNTWRQATEELLKDESFGLPLDEDNRFLDDILAKVAEGRYGLDQVKAIYYYVTGHFTCTSYYDKYIRTNLRDVVKKNSGTVGDLNLLLIAMLRKQGFFVDPVLLSTRDFGFNLVKYPVLSKLNYVIARVSVQGKVYYLDAAHPQLGFGQLAGNCYNGHARIISKKDSASVYFDADSLLEKKSTMVFITPGAKGGLEGTYQSILGLQESYNTRDRVRETGQKEYFKKIQTAYGDELEISNPDIDSLKRPEDPVGIHYDFGIKQGSDAPIIYFNPLLAEAWRENPFKAAERKYPVEMPYAMDDLYVLNMEIPAGYAVDEMPKSAKVAYNGDQGSFEYLIAKQGATLQLSCHLKLNRAYFPSEDYATLREFFGFVVKKESEQIVLKKQ